MPYVPDSDTKGKGKNKGIHKGLPTWLNNKIGQAGLSTTEYTELSEQEAEQPHSQEEYNKLIAAIELIKQLPDMEEAVQKMELTIAQMAPPKTPSQINSQIRSLEDQVADRTQKWEEAGKVEEELNATLLKIRQVRADLTSEILELKKQLADAQKTLANIPAAAQMEFIQQVTETTKQQPTAPTSAPMEISKEIPTGEEQTEGDPKAKIQRKN